MLVLSLTALDMWSAGIILLAFLTKRFPLFNSNDDTEALLELMMVFGKKRIAQCALLHSAYHVCCLLLPSHTNKPFFLDRPQA